MKYQASEFQNGISEIASEFNLDEKKLASQLANFFLKSATSGEEPTKVELFRRLFANVGVKSESVESGGRSAIKKTAYMMDCSRNSVPTVATIKKFIRHLAVLGYDILMLYLEDTFEVNNEPYFGYFRGRYSKNELKEIVSYADEFGIEVVPCIQTLAHYNQLVRWYEHLNVFDIGDILMVGEPRVKTLLENIFATLRECFTSDKINIGMDEAYLIGRGQYLDKHGPVDRFDIMNQQLDLVTELSKKFGFKPMMWSDMFFKLVCSDNHETKGELPEKITELVKDRVDVVYWDYYHTDIAHYDEMFKIHKKLKTNVFFAGGCWKWSGFTPDNRYAIKTLDAGFGAAKRNGIELAIVTGWGDNGSETALFSILPALVYASVARFDGLDLNRSSNKIMMAISGLSMSDFMNVDLANRGFVVDEKDYTNTTNKSMLFNDPLLGVMDSLATFIDAKHYQKYEDILLAPQYNQGKFAYVFATQKALLSLLSIKADLGLNLRSAYKQKNTERLKVLLGQVDLAIEKLDAFYAAFYAQWHLENKPHGFDVEDLRIGGLRQRLVSTKNKLSDFLTGKIENIAELEEEVLDFMCKGKEFTFDFRNCEYRLKRISSVNVND